MKLTVLVDNNTIDFSPPYLFGQAGLSFFVEDAGEKILWDTGASDVFLRNAEQLGIDLAQIGYLAISHGHNDHTWGLEPFLQANTKENTKNIKLVSHPDSFCKKTFPGYGEIGSSLRSEDIRELFDVVFSKAPYWLTERVCFLGEIPRVFDFEQPRPVGNIIKKMLGKKPDFVMDDSALVYKSKKGLVIITGCAHAGICNTIEYAKKVCQEERIVDVIGGMHLLESMETKQEQIIETGEYLQQQLNRIHPCHCTDLQAKIALSNYVPVADVGSGFVLEYD